MVVQRPRVGIGALLFRDGKVLLGKRTQPSLHGGAMAGAGNAHGAGDWAPPGGHLEFGETFEACAAREVLEETGLSVGALKVVSLTNDIFNDKHYVTIILAGDCPDGEPLVCEPEKCESWQWFDIDNLPEPLFLPLKNALAQNGRLLG